MSTRRDTGIFQRLKAERALPLLPAMDPLHNLFIFQIVSRAVENRRVRDFLQRRAVDRRGVRRFEEQRVVRGVRVWI
jgi:hypothetical protein